MDSLCIDCNCVESHAALTQLLSGEQRGQPHLVYTRSHIRRELHLDKLFFPHMNLEQVLFEHGDGL